MSQKKYLTLEEAAKLVHMPVSSLRRKISDGLLPGYKPGKSVLVEATELDLFIRRNKVDHAS